MTVLMEHSLEQARRATPWRVPGTGCHARDTSSLAGGSGLAGAILGLADGGLLAQFRASAGFTGLLVILAFPQLFLNPASLQQLLEAAQGQTNRLPLVDAHPQRHASPLTHSPFRGIGRILCDSSTATTNVSLFSFPARTAKGRIGHSTL